MSALTPKCQIAEIPNPEKSMEKESQERRDCATDVVEKEI